MWVAKSPVWTPRLAAATSAPALIASPRTLFDRIFMRIPILLEVRIASRMVYPPQAGRTHAVSAAPAGPCLPAGERTSTLRQPAWRRPGDAAPAARSQARRGLQRLVDRESGSGTGQTPVP